MEYLYDGLWKAARFPISVKMIDPVTSELSTIKDQINIMIEYVNKSLQHFSTLHIIDRVNNISRSGTEADDQIEIYNQSGFIGLKKYLMNNTKFQMN